MIETSAPSRSPSSAESLEIDAGWDPDPTGRHQLRYWDGVGWTQWVSDFDVLGQDPMAVDPEVPVDPEAATPLANGWVSPNGNAVTNPRATSMASDRLSIDLAEQVEGLVQYLRSLSRRNRRIGTDVELSELSAAALRLARLVQGRPVPDDER